jgi:hypothetical protein
MGASTAALGKIICLYCRRTDCIGPCQAAPRKLRLIVEARRVAAWLGGAAVAGTAVGAAIALLFCG